MKYSIELQASVVVYSSITIEAETEADAEDLAVTLVEQLNSVGADHPMQLDVNYSSVKDWEVNAVALADQGLPT